MDPTENEKLSKLLFDARESIEMFVDILERRTKAVALYERGIIKQIDEYRKTKGWSPHGFGGEQ